MSFFCRCPFPHGFLRQTTSIRTRPKNSSKYFSSYSHLIANHWAKTIHRLQISHFFRIANKRHQKRTFRIGTLILCHISMARGQRRKELPGVICDTISRELTNLLPATADKRGHSPSAKNYFFYCDLLTFTETSAMLIINSTFQR